MKLISWNVNGIRACVNKGFKEFFNNVDADIFCIQETKCQPEQIELNFEGYKSYWNSAEKKGYSGTAIGSAAAALAGFVIFSCMPIGTWQISALGYGFLVLAIEIFGNWKATNIIFCSLFFAFFFAFAPTFTAQISIHPEWGLNNSLFGQRAFYYLLPYFLALLSLVIFSKKSRAPKAEGIPYDKSTR